MLVGILVCVLACVRVYSNAQRARALSGLLRANGAARAGGVRPRCVGALSCFLTACLI